MTQSENRWFPPSPHKEKVLEAIAQGVAHIVERGHNVPPLLVFEDGGAIELPRVRYQQTRRGMALIAGDAPATKGATRFYDVCGTVDEIKGCIEESESTAAPDIEYYESLLEDIRYMLGRMGRRSVQYHTFLIEVRQAVDPMLEMPLPDVESADERVNKLAAVLAQQAVLDKERREQIDERAEHVRDLATALESYLAAGKDTAMQVGDLFSEIKGGRVWQQREDDTESA